MEWCHLFKLTKGEKNVNGKRGVAAKRKNGCFREKVSDFSLDLRQIRTSAVFRARRETALRGEGFAWVPDLGSFLKLREVRVSPYLGFILRLSTM